MAKVSDLESHGDGQGHKRPRPEGRKRGTRSAEESQSRFGARWPTHNGFHLDSLFAPHRPASKRHSSLAGRDRTRSRGQDGAHEGHVGSRDQAPQPHERHHHHRTRHDHLAQRTSPSRSAATVRIVVHDLNHQLRPFRVELKSGTQARRIADVIRKRHAERAGAVPETARIRLYREGLEIQPHEMAPDRPCIVWHRLELAAGRESSDDGLSWWKLTHWQDETNGVLDKTLTGEIVRAIESGETIGSLRRIIAARTGVEDANRVVIIARDGVRRGLVQGDSWEARQLRNWLCRWLSIDTGRERGYVVLKGLARQYIYHPAPVYLENGMTVTMLKKWMKQRLFTAVDRLGQDELSLASREIAIREGEDVPDSTPVRWGATYTFSLPAHVAEALGDAESWLLPVSESCSVCGDAKKITELPAQLTAECDHRPSLCKDCTRQWIHSSLESTLWDRLKCPECPKLLQFHDVQRYASPEDFVRYDTLATRAALKGIDDFRWCLSPTCESGQIHDRSCAKFRCVACKAKHCVAHDVPWHSGETCAEYDKRTRRRRRQDRASRDTIEKTSKKCPGCGKDVHKWTGCNHITCLCGHEWCYLCLAPYRRNAVDFIFCRHAPGCAEANTLADMLDPELPLAGQDPRGGGQEEAAADHLFQRPPGQRFPPALRFPPPLRFNPARAAAMHRQGLDDFQDWINLAWDGHPAPHRLDRLLDAMHQAAATAAAAHRGRHRVPGFLEHFVGFDEHWAGPLHERGDFPADGMDQARVFRPEA
ncbi:hypothetical protein VTK73DRAFT_9296 [Phialemonium thermophilum]|uniref:RBR-type E3 ubiquitin transferase n=1 Tax=Phialemonium thermophilum TaxID=223376 RepID=A0ABR3XKE5_9PEZI